MRSRKTVPVKVKKTPVLRSYLIRGSGVFPKDMMQFAEAKFASFADGRRAVASQKGGDKRYAVQILVPEQNPVWEKIVRDRFASFGAKMEPVTDASDDGT